MPDFHSFPPACWTRLGDSELARRIWEYPLCDTHEHLQRHTAYGPQSPDILGALFDNYVLADLVVAGADPQAVDRLITPSAGSLAARFQAIEAAWQKVRHTGYGAAVRLAAEHFYGLETLTPAGLEAAQEEHAALMRRKSRLAILREDAGLDHVQIDDFTMDIVPDEEDASFFRYDISLAQFVNGVPDLDRLGAVTGVEIADLRTYQSALEALFDRYGAAAIACKTQHAYERTLAWSPRDRSDAAVALERYLKNGRDSAAADRLLLGDWSLDLCASLARRHGLPIKIHTGYYAGHSRMPLDFISCRHLCPLLQAHPGAQFVLMHNSYPYGHEIVALAKHYPNAFIDMCWAWSIDPYAAQHTLRHCIHAVPLNKVFLFGADTFWAFAAYAYAVQARWWLTRTLQAEMAEYGLTEKEALAMAERFMYRNQYECFAHLEAEPQTERRARV